MDEDTFKWRQHTLSEDEELDFEGLYVAAIESNVEGVRRSLSRVPHLINWCNPDAIECGTPLRKVASGNGSEAAKIACASLLLDSGAHIDGLPSWGSEDTKRDDIFIGALGTTPLDEAVDNHHAALVEVLLERGANPNLPGWMALTAVDRAIRALCEASDSSEREIARRIVELVVAAANHFPPPPDHDGGVRDPWPPPADRDL